MIFLIVVLFTTGCTNTASAPVATPTSLVIYVTVTQTPIESAVPVISPTASATKITTTTPDINTQVTLTQADNPHMENLQFTRNVFPININNCPMQQIFPDIANDPTYGLTQSPPKIEAISAGQFNTFLREYTEGSADTTKLVGVDRCEGSVVNPTWNFVEVSAKVTPTNARPVNYTISMNVRSQGKIIAQFPTTEKLTLGQIITFSSYIPLKTDDMNAFDSIEVTYEKQSN